MTDKDSCVCACLGAVIQPSAQVYAEPYHAHNAPPEPLGNDHAPLQPVPLPCV